MNNKILLRIISVLITIAVVLTVGGCKSSTGSGSSDIIDGNGEAIQPSINNDSGEAIIKYTTVNSEGKEEEATKVLNVGTDNKYNEIVNGSSLDKVYKTDDEKNQFIDKAEDNGIDKDKAEDIINNAAKWVEFGYAAYVANTSSKKLITESVEISKQKDNIVVNTKLDCQYGIASGSATGVYVSGYVNINEYPDEESLLAELNGMDIKLIYTLVDKSVEDIDDWSQFDIKKMNLNFSEN